ncbi:hypothetical protein, partial [Actinomadura sp. BRA 177]|uniref:hypothetical protein n=1 Tax=Actinomadura sp. BRA 177 TaxID=2745202 RepID=UPI001595975B
MAGGGWGVGRRALSGAKHGQDLEPGRREVVPERVEAVGMDGRMVAAGGNADLAQVMAVLAERDDGLATLGEDDLVNVYRDYENGLRQAEEYRPGRF